MFRVRPFFRPACASLRAAWTRVWAALLLAVYLATLAPVGLAAAALAATIETTHEVVLYQQARGFQLHLRHDTCAPASHRHDLMSSTLAFFAQPAGGLQPDHVLEFETLDASRENARGHAESAPDLPQPSLPDAALRTTEAGPAALSCLSLHSPSSSHGRLLSIRTTVLRL